MSKQAPKISPESPCPCGSGRAYAQCCRPLLQRERTAANAEELMRSRYTAHVLLEDEYLHRTYLGTANKPYVEENEPADIEWAGLTVHAHETGPKPDTAYVDFTARFKDGDAERAIHERSEFQRINGTWLYTRAVRSGPAPVKSSAPKVGRNEPCPCGSGKKYKHCCGK